MEESSLLVRLLVVKVCVVTANIVVATIVNVGVFGVQFEGLGGSSVWVTLQVLRMVFVFTRELNPRLKYCHWRSLNST